jgi:hypothetical protein
MKDRSHWLKIGKVLVNPDNPIAVGIAYAGLASQDVGYSRNKPADERPVVSAAEAKRARRQQKRLANQKPTCYICAREIKAGHPLCDDCRTNQRLLRGSDERITHETTGGDH